MGIQRLTTSSPRTPPPKSRRRLEAQTSHPDLRPPSIVDLDRPSRKSLDLSSLVHHRDGFSSIIPTASEPAFRKFTPPPSPTPDKRWPSSSSSIRYKSNINPFTPEGRIHKPDNVGMDDPIPVDNACTCRDDDSTYLKYFEPLCLLGKGTYGEVFQCRHRVDGMTYAVKRTIRRLKGRRDRQIVLREVYGLAAVVDHSHIVRYYNAWEEGEKGGTLEDRLQKGGHFTEAQLRDIAQQVTSGLNHIHSLGLVHLDIKPDNIYIKSGKNSTQIFKIGDLGLMSDATSTKIFMDGDCRYLSRELLEDDMSCLRKSDVFSLGASIYELSLGRRLPTGGKEWEQIRNGVLLCSSEYPEVFWDLIKSCMHPDPTKRPTTDEILLHPFLRALDAVTQLKEEYLLAQQEIEQLRQQVILLNQQLQLSPSASPPSSSPSHPSAITSSTNLPTLFDPSHTSLPNATKPNFNEHLANKLDKMQL